VPYVDSAIPDGSMSLSEAMRELEHLRRTNHSLVESLSNEKQHRKEIENKLSGVQVVFVFYVEFSANTFQHVSIAFSHIIVLFLTG